MMMFGFIGMIVIIAVIGYACWLMNDTDKDDEGLRF